MPSKLERLFNVSYTGQYIWNRKTQIQKIFNQNDIYKDSKWTSKLGRFCIAILFDVALGIVLTRLLQEELDPHTLSENALYCTDFVVSNLRRLIVWLMGAPAGLKLNSVLSQSLGKFFLYHIHLWVTFLYATTPYLSDIVHRVMYFLAYMGFCFQVSVFQDTLNLITFHIHCFYAYARRIFISQTHGLLSLWRLFRGKKYNPLRDRVDSSANDVDQLFVGTVAFTVLLFLYPTTLMYFAVFKALESVLAVINFVITSLVSFTLHLGTSQPPDQQFRFWNFETKEKKID